MRASWPTLIIALALLSLVTGAKPKDNSDRRQQHRASQKARVSDIDIVPDGSCPKGDKSCIEASRVPAGHGKPLGEFAPPGPVDVFDGAPDPEYFWREYVMKNKPVLFKGAAKKSPAFTKWTDEYMRENFGHYKVKYEPKKEDRLGDYCGQIKMGKLIECPDDVYRGDPTFMKLGKFLEPGYYLTADRYVITQLPHGMFKDIYVPPSWQCGKRHKLDRDLDRPWLTQMYETNFWMSYNEGKNHSRSVIHYDMNEGMMCLFSGQKEWFFIDSTTEIDKVPMYSGYYDKTDWRETTGSDDSPINGEWVDLITYPEFANVKYERVMQEAGDCLFVPATGLHYVRSFGRNVGMSMMIQTHERFDPKVCPPDNQPTEWVPLDQFDIIWDFPGVKGEPEYNVVKMGYPYWKFGVRELVAGSKDGSVAPRRFAEWFSSKNPRLRGTERKRMIKSAWKELSALAGKEGTFENGIATKLDGRKLFKDAGVFFRRMYFIQEQGGDEEEEDD